MYALVEGERASLVRRKHLKPGQLLQGRQAGHDGLFTDHFTRAHSQHSGRDDRHADGDDRDKDDKCGGD